MNEVQTIASLSCRLARRERELLAVHRISAALQGDTRLDQFIRQALITAIDTLEARGGAVLLHDPETDALVFRYLHGLPAPVIQRLCGRSLPVDRGVCGLVFRTGHGVVTPCAGTDPHYYEFEDLAAEYQARDLVTAPLKSTDGRGIGVLQVLNRRRGRFDAEDLKTLEILGSQAAAGIETARLQEKILNWEVDKRRFACEVLRCVTNDKLHLVEPADMKDEGEVVATFSLGEAGAYGRMRHEVGVLAQQAGMDIDRSTDLILAAGEAAANTIKHGINGRAEVRRTEDRILVDILDDGPGIRPRDLPRVLFQPGFSTKISLGMGYTLMMELADRIWLATGPEGTHIRLEKHIVPPAPRDDPFKDVLDRYGAA